MEKEVLNFMEAKTGSRLSISGNFSKPSGGEAVPMDVDSLVKAVGGTLASLVSKGAKGGGSNKIKFDGNCLQCGKYGHMKKDCWQKQQQPNGKGKPGSASAGSAKRFEGKCDNCGKVGHKKKDCWVKGGNASGGKAKGKDKGKSKGKSANSLVQEPEPPTVGETNALELCGLRDGDPGGGDQEQGTWYQGRWLTPAEAEAELNLEDYVEVQVDMDSPWAREDDTEAVSEVTSARYSTASFASRISGNKDGWIRCNLDTGASISAFSRKFKPQAVATDSKGFRTASGELIQDYGKIRLRAWDEKGNIRLLGGQVTDVKKILISAAKINEKGH